MARFHDSIKIIFIFLQKFIDCNVLTPKIP
jgi:hypothetical protein